MLVARWAFFLCKNISYCDNDFWYGLGTDRIAKVINFCFSVSEVVHSDGLRFGISDPIFGDAGLLILRYLDNEITVFGSGANDLKDDSRELCVIVAENHRIRF